MHTKIKNIDGENHKAPNSLEKFTIKVVLIISPKKSNKLPLDAKYPLTWLWAEYVSLGLKITFP